MTIPYLVRLLCLTFAFFYLVHAAVGLLIALLAPSAILKAEAWKPRSAAWLMFVLRLAPALTGVFFTLALCLPAYLRFEAEEGAERVGFACLTAAVLGACVWGLSIWRVASAAIRSSRYLGACLKDGRTIQLAGSNHPVCVVPGVSPALMLAGVFQSRLVLSNEVLRLLPPEQLAAALRHEEVHRASRDNLKRLLVLAAPGLLPGWNGLRRLECAWLRFSEWAADDGAVQGDSYESVSLASALVSVARFASPSKPGLLASLFADPGTLSARVERLLVANPATQRNERVSIWRALAIVPVIAVLFATMSPDVLATMHALLEQFLR